MASKNNLKQTNYLKLINYDCIILPGSQPNLQTWQFPRQIQDCIELTARLIRQGVSGTVIATGRWSRQIEDQKLSQPFVECDKLAELLTKAGVSEQSILKEGLSTDTISNIHNVKVKFLIPMNFKRAIFVIADFRLSRFSFLVNKILGPDYLVDYQTVAYSDKVLAPREASNLKEAEVLLASMTPGDHSYLSDRFYKSYYNELASRNYNR